MAMHCVKGADMTLFARRLKRLALCFGVFFGFFVSAVADSIYVAPLTLGQNANGQLEVFKVDQTGRLFHRWRKASNGAWSSWVSLGGALLPGISIVNNSDGEMVVFGVDRTTRAMEYISQLTTNSLDWTAWTSLGGTFEAPVTAARNMDGRLVVFAVEDGSHQVKECWQRSHGGWSDWMNLGINLQAGLFATTNNDGRIELFGLGSDGALLHCWQLQANAVNQWSDWKCLGTSLQSGFTACAERTGRLEVFAVNRTNDEMLRICEAAPSDSTNWTAWESFGGKVKPGLAAAECGSSRLEVFAICMTNLMLMHRWEMYTNTSDIWSDWADLGEKSHDAPAVTVNSDGDLEVFSVDESNQDVIHHRRQFSFGNDWLDWSSLDHPEFAWASRSWQVDEGLPDNLVQAITQTIDGFLWVGTRSGLARFDGNQFLCYDSQNTPELKNSSITALCADRDGALWIGTAGGGVVRMMGGNFSEFSTTNGMAGNEIQVISQSRDGTLWIGTTTGMSQFRNGIFRNYSVKNGLLSDLVRCIYEDSDRNLWIATGKGLNRLSPDGKMDAFPMPNGLPNDSVRAICQDRAGRVWIGSNDGLLWYEWFWKIAFYAYNTKYGLSDIFVSAICEDGDGNLWVGTYSGLNRFRDGWFYNQPDGEGQLFDRVNALYVDREGDLWVGSKEGLSRLTPEKFYTYTKQQGLTHNNVMSVLQDSAGTIWAGTWGGGLDEIQNEKVTAFASTNGLSEDLILSLCAGKDGSIWAGADFDGGLMQLKNGQMTRYTWTNSLINAGLRVLHEDTDGNLWIGTDRGLNCFNNGRCITNHVTERLAGVSVRDISTDPAGALWFATANGLFCSKDRQLTAFTTTDGLPDDSLTALFTDRDGVLWIGTSGNGLVRYHNGKFASYNQKRGLYSDEIFGIAEDNAGWLWMTCSKGVFRVRKSDLEKLDRGEIDIVASLVYGRNDGMKSPQCNGGGKPSIWKSSDGRLWFPTSKGLVVVDPESVGVVGKPPAVFIETVTADAKTVEDGRTNIAGTAFALGSRSTPLRIGPGHGELEFQYAGIDYPAPEKVQFKYRLSGVDSGWMNAGGRHTAYYTHLAPGTYQFEVRACNRDGVWNQTGARIEVILLPHYWQTWWFRGALIFMVVGGASGAVLYGTRRRMQRKLAILERQQAVEKERGRIAKDMHDQIGAGLTQIGLLGEFARRDAEKIGGSKSNAEKICGMARELAQTVDEIVWTVNPKNDTLNKLGAYLAAYAEDFFQSTSIRCRLDIPPGLPAYPVSAELRHNLFLTVKEALNNIIKHSHATEARLQLAVTNAGIELVVQDDGVGFLVNGATSSRNGMSNMRERIAETGGQFEIISSPASGTRICLRIPIQIQQLNK